MARMIPHAITPEMIAKYGIHESEVHVFEELRKLPDEYVCVWSVRWTENIIYQKNGEADFLIIHPDFPLTVLEVKSGKYKSQWGKWELFDGSKVVSDKSPLDQAHVSRSKITESLRKSFEIIGSSFLPTAAVALLLNTSRDNLIGTEYDFVLTCEDFKDFKASLEKTMRKREQKLNRNGTGIGKVRADFLKKLFSVSPSFQIPLRSLMELDNSLIERLSVDHYLTLDQLAEENKVVVHGGAGTGKTILATEKAIREAQDGRKTLLVCYNNNLTEKLSKQLETCSHTIKKNLDCMNYHQLCRVICQRAGKVPNGERENARLFFEQLETNAEYAILNGVAGDEFYDSIIVDEGQDFKEDWWRVLNAVRKETSEGCFWIFKDEFQNVQHGEVLPLTGFFNFHLLRNFRNSREVFKFIRQSKLGKFLEGTVAVGPTGAECQLITTVSREDMQRKLTANIRKLIEIERIPPSEIVILTGKSLENKENTLYGKAQLDGIPLSRGIQPEGNAVMVETVRKYKGLENKFVLLLDVDESDAAKFEGNEQLVYVGASRAMTALTIFANRATLERLGFVEPESAGTTLKSA